VAKQTPYDYQVIMRESGIEMLSEFEEDYIRFCEIELFKNGVG